LSIIFTHNFNFHKYIQYIVDKSLKILSFIKRHTFEFKELSSFETLSLALVKHVLEYGSLIWGLYINLDRHLIECVQERFLKYGALNKMFQ